MSIFSSSLARNTLALMAAGSAVLIAIMVFSFLLVGSTRQSARDVEVGRDVRIAATIVLSDLIDAETGQRGYLITGREEYLRPYEETKAHLAQALKDLEIRARETPEIQYQADRIEDLAKAKMQELTRTIEVYRSGDREAAFKLVQTDDGKKVMDEARQLLDQIIAAMNTRVNASLRGLETSATRLSWATLLGGFAIALFSAAAYFIVYRYTAGLVEARREVMELNENLEGRVVERTTDLTRANDEIQRFAYIVSHDLRAPLVNIMGFTSELEVGAGSLKTYFGADEPTDDQVTEARRAAEEEIPEAVHFIRASTTKMDGLIGAILKLSREGRREMRRERVDFDSLFDQAVTSLQHQLDTAEARVEIPEALPSVVGDRLALEQVFGNILENAVKYLVKGRPGLITVTAVERGGRVKINVKDNGRGIEEKDLERIFELFRRAGAQDRPGEGVGLAHVRALVRRMGGDVTVSSKVGDGTAFEVDLPKKAPMKEKAGELGT
jgi:signal transduction histidine kinase